MIENLFQALQRNLGALPIHHREPLPSKEAWETFQPGFVFSQTNTQKQADVILIQPDEDFDTLDHHLPKNILTPSNYRPYDAIELSSGPAMIASALEEHTDNKVAIWYGHHRWTDKKKSVDPTILAAAIIGSKAKTVGFSLSSYGELIYATKVTENLRQQGYQAEIISGGPYATVAKDFVATKLGIPPENVATNKGVRQAVALVTKHPVNEAVSELPTINPDFFKVDSNIENIIPHLPLLTFGQLACIGTKPCEFCVANIQGRRIEIPITWVYEQITELAAAGFRRFDSAENWINFLSDKHWQQFVDILTFAQQQGMNCGFAFTRPEIPACDKRSEADYALLKKLNLGTLAMGVESGGDETLRQMGRIQGNQSPAEYRSKVKLATKKILAAGLDCNLSFIFGFPLFNPPDSLTTMDPQLAADQDMQSWQLMEDILNENHDPTNLKVNLNHLVIRRGSGIYNKLAAAGLDWEKMSAYNASAYQRLITTINSILGFKHIKDSIPVLKAEDIRILLQHKDEIRRTLIFSHTLTQKMLAQKL